MTETAISPLRRRMIEDMEVRGFTACTQRGYITGRTLSPDEVARLLEHAPGLKARAALSLAYGAGLRASEVVSLKVGDIDSERRVIRV